MKYVGLNNFHVFINHRPIVSQDGKIEWVFKYYGLQYYGIKVIYEHQSSAVKADTFVS